MLKLIALAVEVPNDAIFAILKKNLMISNFAVLGTNFAKIDLRKPFTDFEIGL
jgi:hypothetical protein